MKLTASMTVSSGPPGAWYTPSRHNLGLIESRALPPGVMMQTDRPDRRATFGDVGE